MLIDDKELFIKFDEPVRLKNLTDQLMTAAALCIKQLLFCFFTAFFLCILRKQLHLPAMFDIPRHTF